MSSETIAAGEATISVTRLGAEFEGDVSEQAVDDLLREIGSVTRGCMFVIGDAINYAEGKWGEKYDHWISVTGLEYQTLRHASSIARRIDLCRRRHKLTFEHHKLVAPLEAHEQERWLDMTQREGMSVRRLRKSLLLGRPATDADMEPEPNDGGTENVHPYVNRLCGFWGTLVHSGWVDKTGVEKLRAFKRDLQPVVDIYNELPD